MSKRRSSSRTTTSAISTLVVLIVVAILYVGQQLLGVDLSATPTPAVENPGSTSTAWYQLYFTDPDTTSELDNPSGGIPDKVAASLDTAQKTIDVAVYEFNWLPLADSLLRAALRGVRVRLVTDTDSLGEEPIKALQQAGIEVVDDERGAIMHDKFVVIDGNTVWTGSMNFTRNDAYRNNNSFMRLTSTRLAQNYTAEFEEMFTNHQFGPTSPANTPNPTVTINGTLIENYFSPDDGVAAHILDVLNSAQSSLYFMAFSFTRSDFSGVLIEKANAGVTVQGVFETRQIAAGGDAAWNALTQATVDVRQDGNKYNLHSKVFIVDGQIVVMGSYNFSGNAEDSNDENVLIIHNPEIAAAYFAEWQKVWEKAGQ